MATEITAEHIGKVVRYYDSGWRFGTLLEIRPYHYVVLHPVSGKVKVPLENLEIA